MAGNGVVFGLTAVAAALLVVNVFLQVGVSAKVAEQAERVAALDEQFNPQSSTASLSGAGTGDLISKIIPTGTPDVYGNELRVSFDDPIGSLDILAALDPDYGSNKIAVDEAWKQRYINVGLQISCEYCCGAKSIVFQDGSAACGCAHSQAMRGLAAYMLKNRANEYTDDQILEELSRWKALWFPKQTIEKAIKLAQESGSTDIDPKLLNEIPEMVGGC